MNLKAQNDLVDKWILSFSLSSVSKELEIKPCGLGSRIRDVEADMVNIFELHGGC